MKYALTLLLTIFGTVAYAQPVFHCDGQRGRVSFQGNPCAEQMNEVSFSPDQSSAQTPQPFNTEMLPDTFTTEQTDKSQRERTQRRIKAKIAAKAETLRVNTLLKHYDDHKAAEYAANNRRCQNALQVASLCGKFAGRFSCDEKGFRPIAGTDSNTSRRPIMSNDNTFKMTQCALQATNGD